MQANRWFMGMGVGAAVSLGGCGDILWKDQGSETIAEPAPFGEGGIRARPPRLPAKPVRSARKAPPAISGGTLAVSPDGVFAVASDPDRDELYVLHLADRALTTVPLASGAEPGRVAFDGAGQAHIVLRGPGAVARLNLQAAKLEASTRVCELPRGIAFSKDDQSLAVACASGDLVRMAANDHRQLSRHFVASDLRDVLVNASGKLQVSRYRSAELLTVDAGGNIAGRMRPAERQHFRFTDAGGQVVSLQPAMGWRTLQGPSGHMLMLHQQAQVEEVQISAGGYGFGGDCSSISMPGVSTMGESGATGEISFSLGGVSLAVDAATSPNRQWLAVAAPGGYLMEQPTLALYSTVMPTPPPFGDAGTLPPEDGGTPGTAVVNCQSAQAAGGFSSQVTAVAFTPGGQLIAQSREPARLEIYEIQVESAGWDEGLRWPSLALTETIPLDPASVEDTGHDLFHGDVGGGITCASCHGEATDDGHVWTFGGIGPRRTQNMRGGLKGTEPFHWDGDMLTFQHLVDDVLTGRMSGFTVTGEFADALVSWIDVQPALRLPTRDAAAAKRGKALFESKATGCQTCHSGPAMTNNGSFDVGTGGTFQVPALHGLGLRGPYMHNGCAPTLRDRFDPTCGGGDAHGKTSQLSKSQIDDLTTYLEGL